MYPNVQNKTALNTICQKNTQCPILIYFGLYKPTPCALSCKIKKLYNEENRKKSKYYLGTPMLKAKFL